MKARLTGLLFSIACCALQVPAVLGDDTDARPVRKTVRAEDRLSIVCEVRGKGDTAFGLVRDFSGLDLKMLLKDAKVPVRCINSGGSFKFFTPTAVAINKKYADYDAVLIEAVGHYPMLEKPAEFNQKLRAVLKEFAAKPDGE